MPEPYLLFLGDATTQDYAKTAMGLRDWAGERCVGEYWLEGATVTTGLPFLTPRQARARGAGGLVIGVANPGGTIPDHWLPALVDAMEEGLDIVSGMHVRLADIEALRSAALSNGRRLIDLRLPPVGVRVASGRKRAGRRLLTVGTDCAVGKKYAALALHKAFAARGLDADFRASGQTGILIAGRGTPVDAVPADFMAGAAEELSPAADPAHWDVIEGQGSLLHPAYAGVSLGLLHGSQPDVFVVCHAPDRTRLVGFPEHTLPTVEQVIDLTLQLGRRTNPMIRCGGVSLNTGYLGEAAAAALIAAESARLGCAVADPMRGGPAFERLVEACLA